MDFLNGENGGVSVYGKLFFELNDNVKINCIFLFFDIYGYRFGLDISKLFIFCYMENLIVFC